MTYYPQDPRSERPDQPDQPVDSTEKALEQLPDSANETTDISGRIWLPERILENVGAILIIALALFVTVTVVMRFVGQGVLGAVELSAIAMVVITVLVVPAATAADDNFKVEIVDMFNRPRLVDLARIFGAVVQLIVVLFLVFSALELLIYDWSTQTTMAGELSLHRYWLSLAVFIGFAVLLHAAIIFLYRLVKDVRGGTPAPPGPSAFGPKTDKES